MATKKAASTKKATVRKPAAAKTTVRTISADAKTTKPTTSAAAEVSSRKPSRLPDNIVNVVFAELVGAFILTLVALATFQDAGALYVGLAYGLLSMVLGAVSGSHLNPAVTFGLWTMRQLKTVMVPFYWGAQFLGALLAVVVTNWIANNSLSLNFDHLWTLNWAVFGSELVGTAVFMFGLAAVFNRRDLSGAVRASGVGVALLVGLVAGGSLLATVKANDVASYQAAAQQSSGSSPAIPHSAYVKGVSLNPAVALATPDHTANELTTGSKSSKETVYSRFSSEVVLGTLVGAALGGNLYLLVAGRRKA